MLCSTSNAQTITIPDVNFKNALINYDPVIDSNGDGAIQLSEAQTVTELYLPNRNIYDLTGIEGFENLTFLWVSNNHLSTLPLNALSGLLSLNCNENMISNLDLSFVPQLEFLECYWNSIESLDLAGLQNLRWLNCGYNLLSDLNLSNATKLSYFFGDSNLFTSLDFSSFTPTSQNPTTYYQLSNNPNLVSVNIKNGAPLTALQPGMLTYPFAVSSCYSLTSICADDFNIERLALYTSSIPNVQLNADCSLDTEAFSDTTVSIYPNPADDFIQIELKDYREINSIRIYNYLGQLLISHSGNARSLEVSNLASGNYIIKFITDNGTFSKQFIKK